jgi:transposase
LFTDPNTNVVQNSPLSLLEPLAENLGMYLRRHRSGHDDQTYEYWTLVKSVRTAVGPRQEMVATLGKLPGLDEQVRAGWEEVQALLDGRRPNQQLDLGESARAEKPLWREVNVREVRVERTREFGEVYLGLALWRRLHLHTLLSQLIESGKEEVRWELTACVLTVARFCGQLSELGVAERWYQRTALEDLLGVPWDKINADRLYRGLDELVGKKDQLTAHLLQRYQSLFGIGFEFLLYDVTSTYFEGRGGGQKAAHGHSRDQRPDCKQVCIGLVVSLEGLPLAFEVLAGNRNDVTTVQQIVTMMENKYGKAQRIWVMDRGMVSQGNLDFLKQRQAYYVVGTNKATVKKFQSALLDRHGWQKVRPEVEVKLVAPAEGTDRFILCRSAARQQKEKGMLTRQEERLFKKLVQIDRSLERQPKKKALVERRIGRWLGRYPAADKLFEVRVLANGQDQACGLSIASRLERTQWVQRAQGAYVLQSNWPEKNPTKFWDWYLQLQQAEAAFRTSKSDLKLRPIFHHKTERVDAHILVCFLSLAMWRTLEMWMRGKGLGTCARQLVGEIGTIKSMDVVLPVRSQGEQTELRLRVVSKPDRMVSELLQRLDLQLPTRPKWIENVVQKIGV